jgi:hypothetical protein
MKKYVTNWDFSHDGKQYAPGATVELEEATAQPLLGGVLSETPSQTLDLEVLGITKLGGGYYQLPTGEKVRGMTAVTEYVEGLEPKEE